MAMVTPNSDEFWPGAVVPLSIVTIEAISGVTIAAAPTPTSSAIVNRKWTSTGIAAPSRSSASTVASAIAACLVVEMAGVDEAIVEELGIGVEGDEVADVDAERQRLGLRARHRVDAQ